MLKLRSFLSHSVVKNTISLGILQVSNYLIPLVSLPYLLRTLGVERYGVVAFGLSIVMLSGVLTDFGFGISATNRISVNRGDKEYVSKLIGAIFSIKVLLCILVVSGVAIFSILFEKYLEYKSTMLCTVFPIIGLAFQPYWFFQGLEKMKAITIYSLLAKLLYLALILVFVKDESDSMNVHIANGVAQLLSAFIAIKFIYKEGYKVHRPNFREIILEFSEGLKFFYSRIAVSLYTTGCSFFLGYYSTPHNVTLYSVSEQLYKAVQFAFMPVNQAIFPYMAKSKKHKFLLKVVSLVFCALGLLVSATYFIAPYFLDIYIGEDLALEVIPIFNIFLVIVLISIPSILLGYPLFSALGKIEIANYTTIAGAISFLIAAILFVYLNLEINAKTIVVLVLTAELMVFMLRIFFGWKLSSNKFV